VRRRSGIGPRLEMDNCDSRKFVSNHVYLVTGPDPDVNTTCHGWTLEFDGARIPSSRASFTGSRGTGLSRRNSRVDRR
jgi:hypothetical protein